MFLIRFYRYTLVQLNTFDLLLGPSNAKRWFQHFIGTSLAGSTTAHYFQAIAGNSAVEFSDFNFKRSDCLHRSCLGCWVLKRQAQELSMLKIGS